LLHNRKLAALQPTAIRTFRLVGIALFRNAYEALEREETAPAFVN